MGTLTLWQTELRLQGPRAPGLRVGSPKPSHMLDNMMYMYSLILKLELQNTSISHCWLSGEASMWSKIP